MDWIWRNGVRLVKKIITAACIVTSAPFIVPPLAIATTIALISSIPYCFFWASYVCIEKLMRTLLPATAFRGRDDKMMLIPNKIGQGYVYDDEGIARVAMSEPALVRTKEEGTHVLAFREQDLAPLRLKNIGDEAMRKESKSLLESIRDDTRNSQSLDRENYRKGFERKDKDLIVRSDAKSENVGGGRKHVSMTSHEGEVKPNTNEASKRKDMVKSSNEVKVLYSEEQIWAKMEALKQVVGYSVSRNTTYSEELKALFMFTGVELPTSMSEKENQDIAQVSERLSFLMSVIGIK